MKRRWGVQHVLATQQWRGFLYVSVGGSSSGYLLATYFHQKSITCRTFKVIASCKHIQNQGWDFWSSRPSSMYVSFRRRRGLAQDGARKRAGGTLRG
eukprot:scaffold12353_cov119-Isochrysis_galbana.AAC.1